MSEKEAPETKYFYGITVVRDINLSTNRGKKFYTLVSTAFTKAYAQSIFLDFIIFDIYCALNDDIVVLRSFQNKHLRVSDLRNSIKKNIASKTIIKNFKSNRDLFISPLKNTS